VKTTGRVGGKGRKRGSGDFHLKCGALFLASKQQVEGASIAGAVGDEPNPKGEKVMQCFFTIRRANLDTSPSCSPPMPYFFTAPPPLGSKSSLLTLGGGRLISVMTSSTTLTPPIDCCC
jgi:hypothetical protein